jgi:hypothetical protein
MRAMSLTAVVLATLAVVTDRLAIPRALKLLRDETNTALETTQAVVELSLNDFRETTADGAVGNIAANGGILASDTTPVLGATANKAQQITWATGNADVISINKSLPKEFDGTGDVLLELEVSSGTTDAFNVSVESVWDNGTPVVDVADDAATKSATFHTVTVTIAAADVPDGAKSVQFLLTPPAHATNAFNLLSAKMVHKRKALAA